MDADQLYNLQVLVGSIIMESAPADQITVSETTMLLTR